MRTDNRVPCKDCADRKIPKSCEPTCERWKKYKHDLEQEKKMVREAKALEKAINKQIWRNSSIETN